MTSREEIKRYQAMPIEEIVELPSVGARIKAARIKAGYLNQDSFAKAIGMKERRGVSRIENGAIPDNYREAINRVTGLPVESMMRERQETDSDLLAKLVARVERLSNLLENHLADQAAHRSRPTNGQSKPASPGSSVDP